MAENFGSAAKARNSDSVVQMPKESEQTPKEGEMTKKVERVTAKIPSLGYLGLALGSMLVSAGLATLTNKKQAATFVGLWVPTLMLVGIYNKLVKLEGSDQYSH